MQASILPPPAARLVPAPDKAELTDRLRKAGLRVTEQRLSLLATLGECAQPTTIEHLFATMGSEACDLVTIYRTMSAFERAGIAYRSGFSDRGAALYSTETGRPRRYPLVRKDSAVIEHLDEDTTGELQAAIDNVVLRLKAKGYGNLDYIVEFFVHDTRN